MYRMITKRKKKITLKLEQNLKQCTALSGCVNRKLSQIKMKQILNQKGNIFNRTKSINNL